MAYGFLARPGFLNVPLASSRLFPHDGLVAKGDELRRVGDAVAARRGELRMTRQELADAAGVDLKTVYNLESGTRWPIARTRAAISAALQWEGDALTAIAAGLTLTPLPSQRPRDGTPRRFPRATPEMQAAMGAHLAHIRELVEAARLNYPGEQLTGAMIFPRDESDAAWWWDRIQADGWASEDIPSGVAAQLAWDDQEDMLDQEGPGFAAAR